MAKAFAPKKKKSKCNDHVVMDQNDNINQHNSSLESLEVEECYFHFSHFQPLHLKQMSSSSLATFPGVTGITCS